MMPICSVPDCESPVKCKGFCKRHYQQQWSTGSPEIIRPNPHGTVEERFWRYVKKGEPDECWPWTGQTDKDGYGWLRIHAKQSPARAHRFSYTLHVGPLPDDVLLRHRCNNPPCVNPAHLLPGDHLANMQDRLAAGNYKTGEHHHFAKFSDETADAVRLATGTYAEIAASFGMSESQVGNIKRGDQRAPRKNEDLAADGEAALTS